jgi:hypothetical protein
LYNNETPLLVDLADLLYQEGIAFYTVLPTENNKKTFKKGLDFLIFFFFFCLFLIIAKK